MTKPLPALGLVIGVIATYIALVVGSYAAGRLAMRLQTFRFDFEKTLPWLALLIVVAVVLGVLMMAPVVGSGATTGAGLLLTLTGLAVFLLPIRQVVDLLRLFEFPGERLRGGYLLFDGSIILFGIPLLLIGIRRWAQDAKLAKVLQAPGQVQDARGGYQPTFPQQQPQQWGGYPGQQQYQPPQQPGHQAGQPQQGQPQQGQPPQNPGQQQ
ncbi:hypothetical protein [Kribbella shirazensis]|uniref:Uncharacterized protein n=1 Tax=Kribbella shirazensis TaxID=1105143 RepID=A0A7X5V8U0_9ACTN|nr:hypothetical protein [Kribbella shirazensis]NIK56724.1 hypothetical protein [Kribbella shirazensis]